MTISTQRKQVGKLKTLKNYRCYFYLGAVQWQIFTSHVAK